MKGRHLRHERGGRACGNASAISTADVHTPAPGPRALRTVREPSRMRRHVVAARRRRRAGAPRTCRARSVCAPALDVALCVAPFADAPDGPVDDCVERSAAMPSRVEDHDLRVRDNLPGADAHVRSVGGARASCHAVRFHDADGACFAPRRASVADAWFARAGARACRGLSRRAAALACPRLVKRWSPCSRTALSSRPLRAPRRPARPHILDAGRPAASRTVDSSGAEAAPVCRRRFPPADGPRVACRRSGRARRHGERACVLRVRMCAPRPVRPRCIAIVREGVRHAHGGARTRTRVVPCAGASSLAAESAPRAQERRPWAKYGCGALPRYARAAAQALPATPSTRPSTYCALALGTHPPAVRAAEGPPRRA
ncbi:hypothetical protein PsYK624_102230 [Phanerochaete sordida]|uniref:Uncharacterized protein n=1 Tax=Phanerochaete sordida TaxID=48140 RepID=A0A9P3GFQ8_9APHY|nr:hypothetical protein PsYK624_102230 [Phanerochaete sordida]